jgi:hypothetical protein
MASRRVRGEDEERPECRDLAWRCVRCGALLGYADHATRTILRLKYKDFFVFIERPVAVTVPCRNCGALNETRDEDRIKDSSGATEDVCPPTRK